MLWYLGSVGKNPQQRIIIYDVLTLSFPPQFAVSEKLIQSLFAFVG